MTTEASIKRAGPLTIRVVPDDPYRIELAGELDTSNADAVDQELELAEKAKVGRIVLDLNRLTFIDSTGLRVLLVAKRRSEKDGGRLRVRAGGEQVRRMMALTGIDVYLGLEDEDPAFEPAG